MPGELNAAELAMLEEARTEVGYADHKASMVLASLGIGFGAVLAGLMAGDWKPSDQGGGEGAWWAGAGLAVLSVLLAASAVWPRYRTPRNEGDPIYFWGHVAAFDSTTSLAAALDESPPTVHGRTRQQLWTLSCIVKRKYSLIRGAFVAAGLAFVAFGVSAWMA